jgi:hypothetical protein
MQLLLPLVLILMNGAYLFVSYHMDEMILDERDEEIEEIVTISTTTIELEPIDILDLDIFDFDVEELAASNAHSGSTSLNPHRSGDSITG